MPELPEVETVMRALRPHVVGRRVLAVDCRLPGLRTPLELDRPELVGRRIVDLRRRAKYLLAELDNGWGLLLHLGMTGAFRLQPPEAPRARHEHVAWLLDDGREWRFEDVRRFGLAELHPLAGARWPACLAALGPEPLGPGFSAPVLLRAAAGRACPVKNLIMDNHVVVGVGNIYASEALFRAGVRPASAAGQLRPLRARRVVTAIREVLTEAIAAGGTTIVDFRTVDGSEGRFTRELRVYGKAGEICRRCRRGRIRRTVLGGRSTYFCAVCQR